MPETVLVNGNAYSLLKLLGKGKGGNCAVLPKVYLKKQNQNRLYPFPTPLAMGKRYGCSAAYCKNSGVFAQYLQPQFSKFHSSM